jgi:hypothetical protein
MIEVARLRSVRDVSMLRSREASSRDIKFTPYLPYLPTGYEIKLANGPEPEESRERSPNCPEKAFWSTSNKAGTTAEATEFQILVKIQLALQSWRDSDPVSHA